MGPLDGIKILDLSRFQACPLCGMILADMGADVIRIEPPEGAPDRTWGQLGPDGETLLYKVVSRNKKAVTLNLNTSEGKEIFYELVRRSDVLLHNFTPGAPMAKEINYERLNGLNASIIVAAVSGYGQNGPDAENPCFDSVAQARSGSLVINGFPGDPPLKTGIPYIDVSSGLCAALGVLLALYYREKTGRGQAIDVSLFDTAFFATQSVGTLLLYILTGEIRKQIGNRGFHSYNGCFKAKDRWVQIATPTNSIWKRFLRAIGREDMANDPRFKNDMERFYNADHIDPIVNEWVENRTAEEVIDLLQKARVPCGVVNTIDQLLTDPQVKAREMIKFMDYPELGKIPVPGIPIKLSLTPGSINTPSPKLGEHNEEVYGGLLGFSPEKLFKLKQEGVI
jgi:crotonobetainyl-CoA:carnitine CoA-transferase CaiB-like acyl-CoA transferase